MEKRRERLTFIKERERGMAGREGNCRLKRQRKAWRGRAAGEWEVNGGYRWKEGRVTVYRGERG